MVSKLLTSTAESPSSAFWGIASQSESSTFLEGKKKKKSSQNPPKLKPARPKLPVSENLTVNNLQTELC